MNITFTQKFQIRYESIVNILTKMKEYIKEVKLQTQNSNRTNEAKSDA